MGSRAPGRLYAALAEASPTLHEQGCLRARPAKPRPPAVKRSQDCAALRRHWLSRKGARPCCILCVHRGAAQTPPAGRTMQSMSRRQRSSRSPPAAARALSPLPALPPPPPRRARAAPPAARAPPPALALGADVLADAELCARASRAAPAAAAAAPGAACTCGSPGGPASGSSRGAPRAASGRQASPTESGDSAPADSLQRAIASAPPCACELPRFREARAAARRRARAVSRSRPATAPNLPSRVVLALHAQGAATLKEPLATCEY